MDIQEYYYVFTLGIVGSLHCIQMCGPLVLSYSLPLVKLSRAQQISAHVFYNLGRITTYSVMGIAAGSAGAAAGVLGRLAGVDQLVTISAGGLMVIAGILMSGLIPSQRLLGLLALKPAAFLSKWAANLLQSSNIRSKFVTGIVLGFLPCGLVYATLIKAVETGDPIFGGLTMASFGLGTVWTLLLLGVFSSTVSHRLRRRANQLASIGIILMGVLLLYRGIVATISSPQIHH